MTAAKGTDYCRGAWRCALRGASFGGLTMVRSRRLSTALIALALLAAGAQRIGAQEPPPPPPQPSNPAIEDWKPDKLVNVEILPKTMGPDEVITLMKGFNASLNVECVFF